MTDRPTSAAVASSAQPEGRQGSGSVAPPASAEWTFSGVFDAATACETVALLSARPGVLNVREEHYGGGLVRVTADIADADVEDMKRCEPGSVSAFCDGCDVCRDLVFEQRPWPSAATDIEPPPYLSAIYPGAYLPPDATATEPTKPVDPQTADEDSVSAWLAAASDYAKAMMFRQLQLTGMTADRALAAIQRARRGK